MNFLQTINYADLRLISDAAEKMTHVLEQPGMTSVFNFSAEVWDAAENYVIGRIYSADGVVHIDLTNYGQERI